jgi:GH24 family phage-related lysozyme (muramidase)
MAMTLDLRVRQQVVRKLEAFEGRIDHFYLDSLGNVTVGVGHFIPNRDAVASLGMETAVTGQAPVPATLDEKRDEYDRVLGAPLGYKAPYYGQVARLRMPAAEINRLRDQHIQRFYAHLRAIYTRGRGYHHDFDQFPLAVQMALFDLVFNLGPSRLVNVFVRLDVAIRAEDWAQAAVESNRPQIQAARNHYVRQLFMTAAGATVACVPFC